MRGVLSLADAGNVDPWVLQGLQQRPVPRVEEVDPLDGFAIDGTRRRQAAERANPGGEVVRSGEVSEVASVAAKQDFTKIDRAVGGFFSACNCGGRRAVPVFQLSVVLEKEN